MNFASNIPTLSFTWIIFFNCLTAPILSAQGKQQPLTSIYPPAKWDQIERRVDKALVWLSKRQDPNGSFRVEHSGAQPAVTSFVIMAFLSRGHLPGKGPYGESLNRAIDYSLTCQQDLGYFSAEKAHTPPERTRPNADMFQPPHVSHSATYNHSITTLMLAEVFGMVHGDRSIKIKTAIDRGLKFSYQLQDRHKEYRKDRGGWRYLHPGEDNRDSDLSVTGWYLMSLRAAKNAGFNIPKERIERVVKYVQNCYAPKRQEFNYLVNFPQVKPPMTGAGALCLALSGKHDDPRLLKAAKSLQKINFLFELTEPSERHKFSIYGCYYCSQAAAQIGGQCWKNTYSNLSEALARTQRGDGRWDNKWRARWVGNTYSTALGVLALTTPYQVLPIYQR